jgi:hypothetical protein
MSLKRALVFASKIVGLRNLYSLTQAVEKVLANPQGIRHDRKRWIDRSTGREEAAVYYVKIVYLMRFTIRVERRSIWIDAEANRSVLVRNPRQWNPLSREQIAAEQALMTLVPVDRTLGLLFH